MKRIELEFNGGTVLEALAQLQARTADIDPVLEEIGEYLIHTTKQRFATKTDPDGSPWADNSPLTQQLKGSNDPLIGESHRLSNEIFRNVRNGVLEVGSPLEYAAMQHFGGQTSPNSLFPNTQIPARPFLGLSDEDEATVLEVLNAYLLDGIPTA